MPEPALKLDPLLKTAQVAKWLGMTPNGVRTMVRRGKLVPDHYGQRGGSLHGHRLKKSTVEGYLKKLRTKKGEIRGH